MVSGGPEKQLNSMEKLVSSIAGRQESIFKEIQAMRGDLGKIAAIEVRRDMEGWESRNTNIGNRSLKTLPQNFSYLSPQPKNLI